MPILVNGELVTKEMIREEEHRLRETPDWQSVPDGLEKNMRLREAAEMRAIDTMLLRQEADKDSTPMDPALVDQEVQRLRTGSGCRVVFDDAHLRQQIEAQMRLQRAMQNLTGPIPQPTGEEIAQFFKAQRKNFQRPETVHAAHIIKHVDETHAEADARAGIEAALAELERGEPFAEVAERHSDCKGNGGDLGAFQRGTMVDEFDNVVFAMQPGQRSPIFRTPFGFHIAEMRAKTPAGPAELSDVRDTIAQFLTAMLQQEATRRAMEALRARAGIRRVSTREAEALGAAGGGG